MASFEALPTELDNRILDHAGLHRISQVSKYYPELAESLLCRDDCFTAAQDPNARLLVLRHLERPDLRAHTASVTLFDIEQRHHDCLNLKQPHPKDTYRQVQDAIAPLARATQGAAAACQDSVQTGVRWLGAVLTSNAPNPRFTTRHACGATYWSSGACGVAHAVHRSELPSG
jgi:hypothetical protein